MKKYFIDRYQKFYHNHVPDRAKHIIIDAACVVSIAILLIAIAAISFSAPRTASPLLVDISISDPLPKSGSRVEFTIHFKNTTLSTLNNLRFNIVLPHYFLLQAVDDIPLATLPEMKLNSLTPLSSKKYVISGQVYGEENDSQSAHITAMYNSSDETDIRERDTVSYTVGQSVLSLESSFPEKAIVNQRIEGAITINNNSDQVQKSLTLTCALPQKTTYEAENVGIEKPLLIDLVSPNEVRKIDIKLRFHDYDSSSGVLSCSLSIPKQEIMLVQASTSTTVSLQQPLVFLSIDQSRATTLIPDKEYEFSLTVHKNEFVEIQKAGVFVEGAAPERFFLNDPKALLSTTIPFTIRIPKDTKKDSITLTPFASYATVDGMVIDVEGKHFTFPLTTSISLSAFARYYTPEGDQIGRGPLPPKVGETTKYVVFVQPTNATHSLSDVTLFVDLADHVVFTGVAPLGGEPLVSSTTQQLLWKYKIIPPSSGDDNPGIVFDISFNPTSDMVGTIAPLINSISIKGKDDVSGGIVEYKSSSITTQLEQDQKAAVFAIVEGN